MTAARSGFATRQRLAASDAARNLRSLLALDGDTSPLLTEDLDCLRRALAICRTLSGEPLSDPVLAAATTTSTQNLRPLQHVRPSGSTADYKEVLRVRVPNMDRWEIDYTDGTTGLTTRYAQWEVTA